MIERRPFEALGGARYDWLKTKHHFSFADYFDPQRMGWGSLRVWNDDEIESDAGGIACPEHFSNQPFSSVSNNRTPQFAAGDDPQARLTTRGRGENERQVTTMHPASGVEDALEVAPAAHAPVRRQGVGRH